MVRQEPFTVLLADDFIATENGNTNEDLLNAHELSGKTQLSSMKVDGSSISNYFVIIPREGFNQVKGLIQKPDLHYVPSNLARYCVVKTTSTSRRCLDLTSRRRA